MPNLKYRQLLVYTKIFTGSILLHFRPSIHLFTHRFGLNTLELAKRYHPEVILLDLDLPDIQGGEVLLRLLEDPSTKTIPIIIISANAMEYQIDRMMKAGATDYLAKPLDVLRFLNTIDRYV